MADCHQRILDKIRSKLGEPFRRLDWNDPDYETRRLELRRETEQCRLQALARVDGLIAGFRVMDKIEKDPELDSLFLPDSLSSTTLPPNEGTTPGTGFYQTSLNFDSNPAEYGADARQTQTPSTAGVANNILPILATERGKAQWACLRTVKGAIDVHYQEAQALKEDDDCPGLVTELLNHFDSPKKLRETAGQVHRDILSLHRVEPSTLTEVFAYTFLSYVVSRVLVDRGCVEKEVILCGLPRWLGAIKDLDEQAAFRFVVHNLWPDQVHRLSTMEAEQNKGRGEQIVTGLPSPGTLYHSPSVQPRSGLPYDQGPSVPPVWYTGFPEAQSGYFDSAFYQNFQDMPYDLTEDFEYAQILASLDVETQHIVPEPPPLPPAASATGPECCSPNSDAGPGDNFLDLENTVVFLILKLFMKELHDLLYVLSGNGMTVSEKKSGYSQRKFWKKIAAEFFEPRRESDHPNPTFQALLGITRKWVEDGYLRSAATVEKYLLDLGEEMLTRKEFREFSLWVLRSPSPPRSPTRERKLHHRRTTAAATESGTAATQTVTLPFKCCLCPKRYQTASGLSKHKQKHKPVDEQKLYRCPKCDHGNIRRDIVRLHYLAVHDKDPMRLPPLLMDRSRGKSGSVSPGLETRV